MMCFCAAAYAQLCRLEHVQLRTFSKHAHVDDFFAARRNAWPFEWRGLCSAQSCSRLHGQAEWPLRCKLNNDWMAASLPSPTHIQLSHHAPHQLSADVKKGGTIGPYIASNFLRTWIYLRILIFRMFHIYGVQMYLCNPVLSSQDSTIVTLIQRFTLEILSWRIHYAKSIFYPFVLGFLWTDTIPVFDFMTSCQFMPSGIDRKLQM